MSLDQLDEAIGIAGGKCLAHQAVLRLGVLQTELIQAVAAATGELQAATARGIDAPIDLISSEIAAGREVGITGFGSFKASTRAERTGRNPRTGEPLTIAASKSSKFVPGATLKTALNGGAK